MKTLLIDDDDIFIMICKKLIQRSNFSDQVEVCLNGQLGLDFLQSSLDQKTKPPDVILLDINMPVMNGWDFLDAFIAWSKKNRITIPVFIISSTVHTFDYVKTNKYPIVKKIYTKPLEMENLLEMKKMLNLG